MRSETKLGRLPEALRSVSLAVLAVAAAFVPANAQDGAQPREIPKDFVLPGPAPTNAPAAAGDAPSAAPKADTGGGDARNPMDFAKAPAAATTDWPCMQRRVERISAGQIWAGPPLPDAASVTAGDAIDRLVDAVTARRLPLAEAEQAVKDYLSGLSEAEREDEAKAFVAVMLDRFNAERSQVMRGIERYGAKQKAMAARLREETKAFSTTQNNPTANPTALDEARQQLLWDTRVFQERRQSLSYVCEVPTLIEQRAFALGRAAEQAL
ncbi:hypothetical protein [Jiella avicenniae]|uniref:LTXXQ motif family protein n=1 Tax=Jiella avicenniae TaxID=2907202 RepID=A0A9X1P5A8_9HYPH|nr:hypothetical protein [Jiella avicenniae]MCE7029511.1 hypothetical protein [Jiella avicenniae]